MNNQNVTSEILNLERKYWTAMRDHDLETALSLTDFPCLVASSHGVSSVDRAEYEKMFRSNEGSIRAFTFNEEDAEVRQVSPDTAVVAYKVKSTFTKEGQSQTIDAVDTSTWVRRDNKWVCAMHSEATASDS